MLSLSCDRNATPDYWRGCEVLSPCSPLLPHSGAQTLQTLRTPKLSANSCVVFSSAAGLHTGHMLIVTVVVSVLFTGM